MAQDERGDLTPLADASGVFRTLALDHRDALRNVFRRAGVDDVSEPEMIAFKCRVGAALAAHVSAILLDGTAARVCARGSLALLVPLEAQGHEPHEGGRLNRLLPDFEPADARALGAVGCKLLLHYRADHRPTAERQRELAARAADACHASELPLVLEPLVYRLDGEDEAAFTARFGELVAAGAADLARAGADLLKLQFPGARACAALTQAAAPLPWALLGGSDVDGETFAGQLEEACDAGASGFIAGRSVWGEAVSLPPADAERVLRERAGPLLARLSAIARERGRPFTAAARSRA